MEMTLRWVDELDCLVVTVVGEFTRYEALDMYDAVLAHPRWEPGANSIFDYSEADFHHVGFDTIQFMAREFISRQHRVGHGRSALIMPKSHQAAAGTVFRNLTNRVTALQTRIVPNFKAALAYVSGTSAGCE